MAKNKQAGKTPAPPKTIKLEMDHLGPEVAPVELKYFEGTGQDYLILGNHRNTPEEYTFWLCVLLVEVNGDLQPEEWWKELPMPKLRKAIDFVDSHLPKKQTGGDGDPLAPRK